MASDRPKLQLLLGDLCYAVTCLTLSFLTGKMSLSAAVRMKENPVWKVLWDVLGAGPHTEHGP